MAHRRPFHRGFHRARATAGADIQLAQAQLRSDAASVKVLGFIDRVAAPAHYHIRRFAHVQRAGVAQDREDQVGDVGGALKVKVLEAPGVVDLSVDEQDIAQHGKEVSLERADNTSVNECLFRRVDQLQLYAAFAT